MKRNEVYEAIEKERISQDSLWPRTDRRIRMYSFTAPHLILLEEKISAMRTAWYKGESIPSDFIKVAAIAVRALEEVADEKFWEVKGSK